MEPTFIRHTGSEIFFFLHPCANAGILPDLPIRHRIGQVAACQVSFRIAGPVQINYTTNIARMIMANTYKQTYMGISRELFQYWGYTGPMLIFLATHIAQNIAETCQKNFQSFIGIEILSQYFCQILQNISLQHYNFNILKYF